MTVAELSIDELVLFVIFSVAMWDVGKVIGKGIVDVFIELIHDLRRK